MTESVIDFPKDGLCPEIWDKVIAPDGIRETYNLKPEVESILIDIAHSIEEALHTKFKPYHITGAITSNSYTENADIDLHFLSDMQYSDEEAEAINKAVRNAYKKVFVGKHPVEVYFQPNKFQDMMSVGCYDIEQHMWLVGPELTDQSFNPYSEYYKEIHMKSESLAQQIRNIIFSIYEIAVVYKKNIGTEFSQSLRPILLSKLADVQEMYDNIRQMRKVYSSPESKEQALTYRSSRKWKIADASFKLFDKYGYLAILKQFIEDYKLMSSSDSVDVEAIEDILNTVKKYINNADKLSEKEIYEDEQAEKYDPPYTLAQIKEKYPKEVYDKLSKCPIHKWRAESGIELIHKEPDRKELERIWKNWNLMSQEMKDKSDKKSLELFGKTNAEHYKELIDSEQVDEGTVQNVLLAALLAVPGILPAKTVQQSIDRNNTYQATMNELNSPKKVRMVGEYTALQAANIIARTLYAEARNDGKDKGFMPVASVIYNRANGNKEDFAKACLKPKQFSCWNKMTDAEKDPKNFKVKLPKTVADSTKNQKLWQQAMEIAADMLADAFKPVTNATAYYNPDTANPSWGSELADAKMIGSHKFGYLKKHTKFI